MLVGEVSEGVCYDIGRIGEPAGERAGEARWKKGAASASLFIAKVEYRVCPINIVCRVWCEASIERWI